ncbi:hypothetical protein KR074_009750 [Drosophila pseudoananassae]|nr:hypothetical protein KR074_009750 [Drosophila pseudoananassae]
MELFFRLSLLLIQLVLLKNRIAKADIAGCHFYDTVKLTSSQRSQNGSYFYQGVEIPPDQTGEYSYIMLPDGKREPVQSHWRGCVCKLKTCIRLCCPPNQYMDEDIVCTDGLEKETWSGHYVNITSGTSVKRLDFHKDFILQGHLPQPCQDLYELEENSGALFENGTFLRFEDSKSLSKQNYCIQPQKLNDSIRILPYNCAIETGPDWGKTVAISTSLFCIIVTIAVYCLAGMLKSFNNVCLIFYMACLGFGSLIELLDTWHVTDNKLCEPTGYLGYFFILSAFCWLSVISRNVGRSIGKCRPTTTQNHSMKKYLKYSGFAWGIPAFLTIAIVLLDFTMNKEQYESWMPGIGFYNCWIKTEDMSAMIYLYGPILILSTYNITVFIHAATKIVKIKMKTRKLFNSGESQISTGADSDMEIFLTCIKLFLVMGLSWGLVIITYLVQKDGLWSTILLPTDYINYSQGTIILVVVLSTKSTRRLLMERYQH